MRLSALGRQRDGSGFELGPCFFEALDLGSQSGGPFDKRRMVGARFSGATAEILGGLARLEQAALRSSKPIVSRPLIVLQPRNRFARFSLTAVDRLALIFGLPALAGKLLALLTETRCLIDGVLQLRLLPDDGFFLFMVLGCKGGNRVRRLRDGGLERRGFSGKPKERLALGLNAAGQIFN